MQEKEAFDIVWNACEGLSRKAFTKLTKELCKVIAPGVEFVRIEEKRAIFRSKAVDLLTVESVFSKVFKEYSFNCCEKLPKLAEAAGFLIETLPNKKSVHKDDFFNPSQSEAACLAVLFYDLIYAICHVKIMVPIGTKIGNVIGSFVIWKPVNLGFWINMRNLMQTQGQIISISIL